MMALNPDYPKLYSGDRHLPVWVGSDLYQVALYNRYSQNIEIFAGKTGIDTWPADSSLHNSFYIEHFYSDQFDYS